MDILHFRDFHVIPLPDGSVPEELRGRAWLLFHPDCGAYYMTIEPRRRGKAQISVFMPNRIGAEQSTRVGKEVFFHARSKKILKADLPPEVDLADKDLATIAIDALIRQNSAEPLRLRAGRAYDEYVRLVGALSYFARRRNSRVMYWMPICDGDPDEPLGPGTPHDDRIEPQDRLFQDIKAWYAPRSRLGAHVKFNRGANGVPGFAILPLDPPRPASDESAHDLLEYLEIVNAFYREAGPELGRTPEEIDAVLTGLASVPRA